MFWLWTRDNPDERELRLVALKAGEDLPIHPARGPGFAIGLSMRPWAYFEVGLTVWVAHFPPGSSIESTRRTRRR